MKVKTDSPLLSHCKLTLNKSINLLQLIYALPLLSMPYFIRLERANSI